MKETPVCDWCITMLVPLACLKMTSKDKAYAGICIFVKSRVNKDLFGFQNLLMSARNFPNFSQQMIKLRCSPHKDTVNIFWHFVKKQ